MHHLSGLACIQGHTRASIRVSICIGIHLWIGTRMLACIWPCLFAGPLRPSPVCLICARGTRKGCAQANASRFGAIFGARPQPTARYVKVASTRALARGHIRLHRLYYIHRYTCIYIPPWGWGKSVQMCGKSFYLIKISLSKSWQN